MTKITNSQQILDQFVGWFANGLTVSAIDTNKPTIVVALNGTASIQNLLVRNPQRF
jgi:hypothetical protein